MLNSINLKEKHKIFSTPKVDVEHRTAHNSDHAILNVFETSRVTHSFDLRFDNPVVVSMIQGKKVMKLHERNPFDFRPGETIVMPTSELMYIDFPEASPEQPTQCLALEISNGFVRQTLAWLNDLYPKMDESVWNWTDDNFHLSNNNNIHETLNRLIRVMVNQQYGRQLIASNTTKELIASLLQTQARHFLLHNYSRLSTKNRLAFIIQYIRKNIKDKLSVDILADKACLSRAQFFRAFQREMGQTPVQFINRERIEIAKRHLLMHNQSATQACYASGFASLNYFSRIFKQCTGTSPTEWRKSKIESLLNQDAA